MVFAFMLYLLCAITDCPPPVMHERSNSGNNILSLFRPRSSLLEASSSLSTDSRWTRDHSNKNGSIDSFPIISTSLGDIQGRVMVSREGREIAAFEGIPYAEPPVGYLRFRNPVPAQPWTGKLRVANKTKMDCLQLDFSRLFQVRGREDCLYINIYTPTIGDIREKGKSKALLPVIVYIHGGGWMSHSSSYYGPRYLLDKDVILVTFNFRLGILGFMSTGDKFAYGNFGLKDQFLALKWVRDYISEFGGDPKKITIMGESTGAGSVALHLLSPMTSKEIPISGAILLSGSSLNHWAIMNDTFSNTKEIAKRMNCFSENTEKLVDCLRQRDPYMLVGQQMHLWLIPAISRLLFGPVLESESKENPSPFITEAPEVTYTTKRDLIKPIPVIAGVNRDEGAMFAANIYLVPFLFTTINQNWSKMVSYAMAYDRLPGVDVNEVSEKIKRFYFNGEKWSFKNRKEISDALGDRTITTGVYSFLRYHSQVAPTYGYFFTYLGSHSLMNQLGLRNTEWGVSHTDELPFIFSMDSTYDEFKNPKDISMSEFMTDFCANFASDRQPFPRNFISKNMLWSPIISPKYIRVLELNSKRRMIHFPYMNRMKFWESLNLNHFNSSKLTVESDNFRR